MTAKLVSCHGINHAWCVIKVKDKSGKSYWKGVYATSFAYNLKSSAPISADSDRIYLTKKQLEKYKYSPSETKLKFQTKRKSARTTPAATATPDTTETSAPTASLTITEPIKDADGNTLVIPFTEHNYTCPGCNVPYRHKSTSNPYITNGRSTSGGITVYTHSTSEGIRYFDANGNEYIDINGNGTIMDELATLIGQ